jgi:hypothetical protein
MAYKMNGFSGFGNSPLKQGKKSYTTGTSDVHSKKDRKQLSQEKFGLYKAGMGAKWHEYGHPGAKYSKKDREAASSAETHTAAALGATLAAASQSALAGGAVGALTGTGIVAAEGVRRMKKGKTGMTTSKATKFSGEKKWKREPKKKYV